jgi:peptidoglycan/LPS O-acetylase OafA/YrhL
MLSVLGAIVLLWPSQMSAPDRTLPSFIACFFLVQTWGLGYPMAWNWPTWSLSTELAAYILFPLMVLVTSRFLRHDILALAISALCLVLFTAILFAFGRPSLAVTGYLALPRCILEFAAGFLLFRATDAKLMKRVNPDVLFVAGILLSALAVLAPSFQFFAPFGFAVIILSCACSALLARAVFANPVSRYLGEISYSLYLVHAVALMGFEAVAREFGLGSAPIGLRVALLMGYWVFIMSFASLTWALIERPGQRLGKRVQAFFRSSPAQALATAPHDGSAFKQFSGGDRVAADLDAKAGTRVGVACRSS